MSQPIGNGGKIIGSLVGAILGGASGLMIRGKMNEGQAVGFANIPGILMELACWTVAGGVILAFLGFVIGRSIDRR